MTDTEAAWLAGIFDGEGCLGYYVSATGKRSKMSVQIRMSHLPTILKIRDLLGYQDKNIYEDRRRDKTVYGLQFASTQCIRFLEVILPYCLTKRQEVEEILSNLELIRTTRPEALAEKRELAAKLKVLKRTRFSL